MIKRFRFGRTFIGRLLLLFGGVSFLLLVFSLTFLFLFFPIMYSDTVIRYSEEYQVPTQIVFAVIHAESDFDPTATSTAGAKGLMQLMPGTYAEMSSIIGESDPNAFGIYDPERNIRSGVLYLSRLYEVYRDWSTALAAYNAGPAVVDGWLSRIDCSSDGQTLFRIPYPETSRYVSRVLREKNIYSLLYFNLCKIKEQKNE